MRAFGIAALLGFALAPVADAQEQTCTQCGFPVDESQKAYWGGKVFCSEACRDEFNADRWRCSICNERVEPPKKTIRTDGFMIYEDAPQPWDGFCDFCREEVRNGTKDPVKDRYRPDGVEPVATPSAAPGAAAPRQRHGPNRAAVDEVDEEASVATYAGWCAGIGIGLVWLLRRLFR